MFCNKLFPLSGAHTVSSDLHSKSDQPTVERRRSHSAVSRIHSFPKSPRPSSLIDHSSSSTFSTNFSSFLSHTHSNSSFDDTHLTKPSTVSNSYDHHSRRYHSGRQRLSPLAQRKLSATKPGLSQVTHESQLALPTQFLVPDTRRSKTVPDFGSKVPVEGYEGGLTEDKIEELRTGSLIMADDVEVDYVKKSPLNPKHKVHQLSNTLASCLGKESSHLAVIKELLENIHKEMGFSSEEHTSLRNLTGVVEVKKEGERRRKCKRISRLEQGWDYNLLDHQPITISENVPTNGCGRMAFRVQFIDRMSESYVSRVQRKENSIMKVRHVGIQ